MKKILFTTLRLLTFNYFLKRKKNSLVIFMFHQVNDNKTTYYPAMSISAFKNLCVFIKKNYTVINPSDIKSHFAETDKPAAIISFDDGHYDIIKNTLPILSELELPFNVNIDTEILETGKPQDFVRVYDILNQSKLKSYLNPKFMTAPIVIDGTNPMKIENEFTELLTNLSPKEKREFTNDLLAQANLEVNPFSKMLSIEDVKLLKNHNVEFGSHSHTHAILTKSNLDQIHYELSHSKNVLEGALNTKIEVLAYPNGLYNNEVEEIAKDLGYTIFLQTDDLINTFTPNDKSQNSFKRVNQYHQTAAEALAHTYGITNMIKKIIG
jgi:peptidoglycan/xylan/chitin deacetylase (PgdA/CDA1 family)